VPAGSQLQIGGIRYQTISGGIYGNGSTIIVQSIDSGKNTDQAPGTTLQWVQAPAYFAPTAIVSTTYPITGGVDAEDDDTARARLSAFLSNPPASANASQINLWAQASDPSIQAAVTYPAARGPSTVDTTVFGYGTTISQNRDIDSTLLSNSISPYIVGNMPAGIDTFVSTVTNYPINVVVKLSLPASQTATPVGPGGGWIDGTPLQVTVAKPCIRVLDGYEIASNQIVPVPHNTANAFWVDFPVAPVNGVVYNISYFSPFDLTLYSAQMFGTLANGVYDSYANYPGLSGKTSLYYVQINAPFYRNSTSGLGIQPGDMIFPSASNTVNYVETFVNYMYSMGPGERTINPGLLPRALRQPLETTQYAYKLDTRLLKALIESGDEVYDGAFGWRGVYTNDGLTPITTDSDVRYNTYYTDYGAITTNSDPAYAQYAPPTAFLANSSNTKGNSYIFTIKNFAIYNMS
jgi:hypothetical protein